LAGMSILGVLYRTKADDLGWFAKGRLRLKADCSGALELPIIIHNL
jgi:hypothetical protein